MSIRWLPVFLAACGSEPTAGWMATQPDERSLAALSIPGTHDSGARFEPVPGLAKTQELTIADQLGAGVRYLDIRCRHVEDQFLIYHGGIDQNQTFAELLATVTNFLENNPSETVIASVKEEATPTGATRPFDATFATYLSERWYLGPTIPRLGEVRGKLVLLRRFASSMSPLGIDAAPWADNATFTVTNGASLRIQDQYMVTDNSAKWAAVTALLAEARTSTSPTLFLNYTSGYQTMSGLPNIPIVADDLGARFDGYLADPANGQADLGVMVMDLVSASRAEAIVATNLP